MHVKFRGEDAWVEVRVPAWPDKEGVNQEGVNQEGVNQQGVNEKHVDKDRVNKDGVNQEGVHGEHVNEKHVDTDRVNKDGVPWSPDKELYREQYKEGSVQAQLRQLEQDS